MNSISKEENKIEASEKRSKVNSYYLVLSGRFKVAKYLSICLLVVFLLSTILIFRDEITVEKEEITAERDQAYALIALLLSEVIENPDNDLEKKLIPFKNILKNCNV